MIKEKNEETARIDKQQKRCIEMLNEAIVLSIQETKTKIIQFSEARHNGGDSVDTNVVSISFFEGETAWISGDRSKDDTKS